MILVDSTKYISWMRGGRNPIVLLAPLALAGELLSCGIVRIEVLRGIVKPKVKEQLTEFFQVVPEVTLNQSLLAEVADMAWQLDRHGHVLPLTDLIVGACAKKTGAVLVTEDPHFQRIPMLKLRTDL